jgi:cobalt-precorrin-5B (C1)-methyltransferase
VELNPSGQAQRIVLEGGEGIGRLQAPEVPHRTQAAIYGYAQELFQANLSQWLRPQDKIRVTIVLPQGRALAQRTSNAAFGVVDGLSLLGTSGIAQPLSSPDQLALFRSQLQTKVQQFGDLVFCIGENGLDLATQLGINPDRLFKTANWLGPLLVEAGCLGVRSILLFGYHGKLIKLAGGIFHTHHHVADARLEILTAHCAIHAATLGIPTPILQQVFACGTVEEALSLLREQDLTEQVSPHPISPGWVAQVYGGLAATIDRRTTAYIHKHSEASVQVGCVLFDRRRQIIVKSTMGSTLLTGLLRN